MESPRTSCTEIRPWLILGGQPTAYNLELLQVKKVTHIINAADDVRNAFPDNFQYLNLNLKDGFASTGIPRSIFTQVFVFVTKALRQGAIILVHCKAGINRSAAVVCAILMYRCHLNYFDALREVQRKRNIGILRCNEESLLSLSRRLTARRLWARAWGKVT